MPSEEDIKAFDLRCPVCQGKEIRVRGQKDAYVLNECRACGLAFCDPMSAPTDFYIQNFDYYLRDCRIVDPLAWERRWDIERFINNPPADGGTLLDIGCGTGFFVRRALDMGFDAYGLETDGRAIESGRAYFALETLYRASVDEFLAENPNKRFRIVTMFQVLEHLEDPMLVLRQVRSMLEPDGVLVLSLPWYDRWPDVLGDMDLPPHHLTRWTEGALREALQRSGLCIRDIVFENFPLSNMTGIIYHVIRSVVPSLTAAGSLEHEGKGSDLKDINSDANIFQFLKKRKTKITLALLASAPLWAVFKLLGAKGPHMYIETFPA